MFHRAYDTWLLVGVFTVGPKFQLNQVMLFLKKMVWTKPISCSNWTGLVKVGFFRLKLLLLNSDWSGELIQDLVDLMVGPVWDRQKAGVSKNPAKPGWSVRLTSDPGDPVKLRWGLVFFFFFLVQSALCGEVLSGLFNGPLQN